MNDQIERDNLRRKAYTGLLQWVLILFISLRIFFPFFMENYFTFVPVILGVAGAFIAALIHKRYLSRKDLQYFTMVAIWWLWSAICFWLGKSEVPGVYSTMLLGITLALLCAMPIAQAKVSKWLMILIVSICISVIVTVVISVPYIQENAYLIRQMASGENWRPGLGIGGYEFAYCIAFLTPCLLLFADTVKGWKKWLAIITIGAVCVYSVMCALFTTLLIVVASILFYLVSKIKRRKTRMVVFTVLVVVLLFMAIIGVESFVFVLEKIDAVFGNEIVSVKIDDIISVLRGGEEQHNTLSGRTSRYLVSLKSFAVSPIIGGVITGAGGTSGGHSMILDYLAITGLVGTVLFFCILSGLHRTVAQSLQNKQTKSVYRGSIIIFFVVAALKNTNYLSIMWTMTVVVPIFVKYLDYSICISGRGTGAGAADQLCQ